MAGRGGSHSWVLDKAANKRFLVAAGFSLRQHRLEACATKKNFEEHTMRKSPLEAFFKPEAVAEIGASEKDNSIGLALVKNLKQGGFPGTVYPVNRNYTEVQGLAAYAVVTEVKAPIDLAVIAIPIREVPGGG